MAGREESASSRKAGLRWGGLWRVFASDLCRCTHTSPSTLLARLDQKQIQLYLQRDIQAFLPAFL